MAKAYQTQTHVNVITINQLCHYLK